MDTPQVSIGLGQQDWHGIGKDKDECWVLTGIGAVFASAPWSRLVSATTFRANAGDPDDGVSDGGDARQRDLVRGVENTYPAFKGKLRRMVAAPWETFRDAVREYRPVSIALMPGKLPLRLQHGVANVPHQCIVQKLPNDGQIRFWNPWAKTGERWDVIELSDVREAMMAYGNGRVYGVIFPTVSEMLPTHPGYPAAIQAIQAENAALRRALEFAQAEAKNAWNSAIDTAIPIANDAAAKIAALRK